MFCTNCGTQLPEKSKICPSCGKPVSSKPITTPSYASETYKEPLYSNASLTNTSKALDVVFWITVAVDVILILFFKMIDYFDEPHTLIGLVFTVFDTEYAEGGFGIVNAVLDFIFLLILPALAIILELAIVGAYMPDNDDKNTKSTLSPIKAVMVPIGISIYLVILNRLFVGSIPVFAFTFTPAFWVYSASFIVKALVIKLKIRFC